MTNALTYKHNFARTTHVDGQRVELIYALDHALWPWLSLPPAHPVLIEKYQYFGATTASLAMKLFTAETHTALTQFQWQCEDAAWGRDYATHGLFLGRNDDTGMGFQLDVSDAQGALFFRTSGDGFVFADRDFRLWRDKTRQQALQGASATRIAPAAPALCGVGCAEQVLIGAGSGPEHLHARVGQHSGFHPRHPFHTGSGDHVNAAQLLDCALQAAHLFLADGAPWAQPMRCRGGQARFQRYVELDIPFDIHRLPSEDSNSVRMQFSQSEQANAEITLQLIKP